MGILLLYLWPEEPERLIVVLPEQALLPPGAPEQGEDSQFTVETLVNHEGPSSLMPP